MGVCFEEDRESGGSWTGYCNIRWQATTYLARSIRVKICVEFLKGVLSAAIDLVPYHRAFIPEFSGYQHDQTSHNTCTYFCVTASASTGGHFMRFTDLGFLVVVLAGAISAGGSRVLGVSVYIAALK